MIELLIIADDFTGALDSAVQFANMGYRVHASAQEKLCIESVSAEVQVLSYSTQSRHLSKEDAYKRVYDAARSAREAGIPKIYKKVDSALRGNVGSELQAVLDGTGENCIYFAPAYPKMGRTTVNGIQLVFGVPISESSFSSDPFNPVKHSKLAAVIGEQTNIYAVMGTAKGNKATDAEQRIVCFDAANDDELSDVAKLVLGETYMLSAGSAGLSEKMASRMKCGIKKKNLRTIAPILFVFGSMHETARLQAEMLKSEIKCVVMQRDTRREAISGYADELESLLISDGAAMFIPEMPSVTPSESERMLTSDIMSEIVEKALRNIEYYTVGVIGGDTLFSVAMRLFRAQLDVDGELTPGVVIASAHTAAGNRVNVVSKAGSFGEENTLKDIYLKLRGMKNVFLI